MLHPLSPQLAAAIASTNAGAAWNGGAAKWKRYLAEHEAGARHTLVALVDERPVGYGSLARRSDYSVFREAGVPELSDLVVAPAFRRRGIATKLVGALERLAASDGFATVGLGVGLYADYGSAQRLYCRLGYAPDGHGLMRGGDPVRPGADVRVDDDLLLYFTKRVA